MFKILTVSLIMAGSTAFAECPKGPLGPEGLQLTRAEPFMQLIYRPHEGGVIEERQQMRNGVLETTTSTYPHPLIPGSRKSATGELTVLYDAPIDGLAKLNKTKKWDSKISLLFDGTKVDQGVAGAVFKANETVKIGKCSYKVWVVEDFSDFEQSGKAIYAHFYAPSLGVVLQVLTLDENSQPISLVAFDSISIPKL